MFSRSFFVAVPWILILVLTSGNFFFWDTIQLASKQASFFFDSGFSEFFLPQDINSGHPPFYGIGLAFFWTLFGKSLLVSHFFNGLFVIAYIFQAHRLGQFFLGDKKAFWFTVVLFCNPIFLGHSILVSPDNALVFLLLLSLNGLLKKKPWMLMLGSCLLAILSMRGMMVVFALYISETLWVFLQDKTLKLKNTAKYLPAGAFALAFLITHYLHNQWLGFHQDSPWEESFSSVTIIGYIRNLGIIGWRLLDFGNAFILIGTTWILYQQHFKMKHRSFFLAFIIGFSIVFVLPLAGFKYLTAHRYFMPIYALISFAFVNVFIESGRKYLAIILLCLMFLGNWWVYPRSISQGWDVSLGHVPFYGLVEEMNNYILEEGIDPATIGTEFPIKTDARYLYLEANFPTYKEAKVGETDFILYSKVMNDYKDIDFYKLQEDYILKKDLNFLMIDLKLYEKRSKTQTRRAQ